LTASQLLDFLAAGFVDWQRLVGGFCYSSRGLVLTRSAMRCGEGHNAASRKRRRQASETQSATTSRNRAVRPNAHKQEGRLAAQFSHQSNMQHNVVDEVSHRSVSTTIGAGDAPTK